MIIIYNVDLYSTKDGRSRLSRHDALFHSSHLGPEFRVLCLLMSVANIVWDAMGSPVLTYLASNISSCPRMTSDEVLAGSVDHYSWMLSTSVLMILPPNSFQGSDRQQVWWPTFHVETRR